MIPLNIQRFASGIIAGGNYNSIYSYYIEWSSTPNVANNSSEVTVNWIYKKNASDPYGSYNLTNSTKVTLTIDDESQTLTAPFDLRNAAVGSTAVIASFTKTISHNPDGTKTIAVSGSHTPGNSWSKKTISSTNITLDTIPRTSSFTADNAEIEGESKISISRASSSLTHTLLYSFGELSGTIAENIADFYKWTIPSNFYYQIPDLKEGTCTITCITYNGSTEIGRTTQNIAVSCNSDKCRPTITGTIEDINSTTLALTGNKNILVKGYSNANVTVSATPKNGARITSKRAFDYYGNYPITNDSVIINGIKQSYEELSAVDSRGFVTEASSVSCSQFIDYIPLNCKAEFKRRNQTSSEVLLDYEGNYFNGSFGETNNTLSLTWKYRLKGDTNWTNGGTLTPTITNNKYSGSISCGSNFDYRSNYEFLISYQDKLLSSNIVQSLTKGLGDFEIYDGALLMNGVVLFYDNEKFIRNSNGTFSRIGGV